MSMISRLPAYILDAHTLEYVTVTRLSQVDGNSLKEPFPVS